MNNYRIMPRILKEQYQMKFNQKIEISLLGITY